MTEVPPNNLRIRCVRHEWCPQCGYAECKTFTLAESAGQDWLKMQSADYCDDCGVRMGMVASICKRV